MMSTPAIVVLGEVLIDVFAEKGVPLHAAKTLYPSPGGAPANVAVALRRLGANVGFIGKVGTDEFGSMLIRRLADEGVDITHLKADPRAPTMLAIVARPSPEDQHFILYNGATLLIGPEDIVPDFFAEASVFAYGSVTLVNDNGQEAVAVASRLMRNRGQQVIFDINLRPATWPTLDLARSRILKAIDTASIVKLNAAELKFLAGTDDIDAGSRWILDQGPSLCCVSLGAKGAYFNNGKASGYVSAFAVEVVDTTGSGDAFVAGLAYQISTAAQQPADLGEEALRAMLTFANACAGLSTTQVGAMSALPTRHAVEALIAQTKR
jgi:sugar/nucleoside kinase (ribokinase family)